MKEKVHIGNLFRLWIIFDVGKTSSSFVIKNEVGRYSNFPRIAGLNNRKAVIVGLVATHKKEDKVFIPLIDSYSGEVRLNHEEIDECGVFSYQPNKSKKTSWV